MPIAADEMRPLVAVGQAADNANPSSAQHTSTIHPPRQVVPASARTLALPDTDEIFRSIYTRAAFGFEAEILAITSATPGEGKTTIGLGLATTLAQDYPDRRVVLVETDLQRPVLSEDFGIEPTPGLIDALVGDYPLQDVCRPTFLDNLDLLPASGPAVQGRRPLRSARMIATLEALRETYHIVILDTPALLANSDSLLLTDLADAVLFVVRVGGPPASLVNKALEQLDDSKLRGIVLNGMSTSTPGWVRALLGLPSPPTL